jgi:flagellin
MRNTQNSISMLQTAEGSFDEMTNMLVRMKDLATQSADASSTTADRTAMQSEFDALGTELANVMTNTTFGGSKLLKAGTIASSMTFQIGASTAEKMSIDMSAAGTGSMDTLETSLTAATTNYATAPGVAGAELLTGAAASTTIDKLSKTIADVGTVRSALGAASNRLDHVYNNLSNISTNTKAATGRIMDVDFASESSNMTSSQMLLQAGTAMLKQSNSMSSMVMSLLQ